MLRLRTIKLVHSVVWAFFVYCIFAIWVNTWRNDFAAALWMIGITAVEVLVLALNRWTCPLTTIAARYTSDSNHGIFGGLYLGGILYFAVRYCMAK